MPGIFFTRWHPFLTRSRKKAAMARRTLNRHELRKQAEQAEQMPETAAVAEAETKGKKSRAKAATPKVKKPRKKKEPPRLCARWGVFDNSMKQVASFAYNQREDADQKVADLSAKKPGGYFIQIVKEPMPEPAEPAAE
jgi:hypothetical protein